jgi:ubiquinone biosynthesis protein Coq4
MIIKERQQQELLLSSFLDMVNATDGDFAAIGKLFTASADDESMDLTIQHLSIHPQGKQAFDRPFSLGEIDLTAQDVAVLAGIDDEESFKIFVV